MSGDWPDLQDGSYSDRDASRGNRVHVADETAIEELNDILQRLVTNAVLPAYYFRSFAGSVAIPGHSGRTETPSYRQQSRCRLRREESQFCYKVK